MEEKKIKGILEEYKKETKRHFDVVAEKIEDKIALVAEQVAANTEKIKEHDKRFDKIEDTLEVINLILNSLKMNLNKKWAEMNLPL
jgi:DNA-binding ferritin-like protein